MKYIRSYTTRRSLTLLLPFFALLHDARCQRSPDSQGQHAVLPKIHFSKESLKWPRLKQHLSDNLNKQTSVSVPVTLDIKQTSAYICTVAAIAVWKLKSAARNTQVNAFFGIKNIVWCLKSPSGAKLLISNYLFEPTNQTTTSPIQVLSLLPLLLISDVL